MIDALLYAVRDNVRNAGLGYGVRECEVMDDGHPQARCGNVFVAVHQGAFYGDMQNALNQYFGLSLTLTMRVDVPLDRVGDKLLALKTARKSGFNDRAHQLGIFLHMSWGVLQDANNLLVQWNPQAQTVYGFCEPLQWDGGMEAPALVGGEWFAADPSAQDVGLKAELRFGKARRLQALATYT